MTELLSLGLDGAAWHKLTNMIADDELPALERLVEAGATGTLESVHPPVTCPAWRCSTSGKNPGKLGVYWWLDLDRETGGMTSPDARSFDTADVWDYLSEENHRSAIVNVPMTYPPPATDGLMVGGFGAPFEFDVADPITHPPAFEDELRDRYDWRIGIDDVTASGGLEATYDLIRSRFEFLLDLLEADEYDYVHLTLFYINVLQHKFGDGPETAEGWRIIDEYLGRLPDDLTKLVYSDHGHAHIDQTFVVNKYLVDQGYLEFEDSAADGVTGRMYDTLKWLGISPRTAARVGGAVLPDPLFERIVESGYPVPTFELADRVDWANSKALALSQGPVYVNRDLLGAEAESFRDQLRDELASLTFDGQTPLKRVHEAAEVYHGGHLSAAPDLMLVPAEGWEIYGGITPSPVERQVTSWTSGNHRDGIVLLHGPDIQAQELATQSLVDVMPTVLRYFGCPVPRDVDGTAIESAFETGLPDPGTRPPLDPDAATATEESDELERRLADLGYLE